MRRRAFPINQNERGSGHLTDKDSVVIAGACPMMFGAVLRKPDKHLSPATFLGLSPTRDRAKNQARWDGPHYGAPRPGIFMNDPGPCLVRFGRRLTALG
jgi:hypothetical protein